MDQVPEVAARRRGRAVHHRRRSAAGGRIEACFGAGRVFERILARRAAFGRHGGRRRRLGDGDRPLRRGRPAGAGPDRNGAGPLRESPGARATGGQPLEAAHPDVDSRHSGIGRVPAFLLRARRLTAHGPRLPPPHDPTGARAGLPRREARPQSLRDSLSELRQWRSRSVHWPIVHSKETLDFA